MARVEKTEAEYARQKDLYLAEHGKEGKRKRKIPAGGFETAYGDMAQDGTGSKTLCHLHTEEKTEQDCRVDEEAYKQFLEETDEQICRLADELNTVRVERRAAEYWVDYYKRK